MWKTDVWHLLHLKTLYHKSLWVIWGSCRVNICRLDCIWHNFPSGKRKKTVKDTEQKKLFVTATLQNFKSQRKREWMQQWSHDWTSLCMIQKDSKHEVTPNTGERAENSWFYCNVGHLRSLKIKKNPSMANLSHQTEPLHYSSFNNKTVLQPSVILLICYFISFHSAEQICPDALV